MFKLFGKLTLGETNDTAYSGGSGKKNADNIQNILQSDTVLHKSTTKFVLIPGKIYAFESAGSDYKVQLFKQDGTAQTGWDGEIGGSTGGIILYPSNGTAKYLGIKGKPSILNLLDFIQSEGFSVNKVSPNIYLESLDGKTFNVWEIGMITK